MTLWKRNDVFYLFERILLILNLHFLYFYFFFNKPLFIFLLRIRNALRKNLKRQIDQFEWLRLLSLELLNVSLLLPYLNTLVLHLKLKSSLFFLIVGFKRDFFFHRKNKFNISSLMFFPLNGTLGSHVP